VNKLKLNHEFSPQSLVDINEELESLLNAKELDDERLKVLIEKRDAVINTHISSLSESDIKSFSKNELEVNNVLSTIVKSHFRDSLKQLSGLKRGHKAVSKYK